MAFNIVCLKKIFRRVIIIVSMQIISAYSVLPLASSIVVFLLGFFIWLKKPKEWLYILFFLYNFTITIWLFGTFMLFNVVTDAEKIYWDRFIYIGVVFIPIFLYHFGLLYCNRLKGQRWILAIGYLLAFIFLPLSQLSNQFVSGLYTYPWGVHTVAQTFHHYFLVFFFFYFIYFFINLWRHYRESVGTHKVQVKYILIGYGILDVIGPLAFLPAYGIPIYPVVFLSAIPFAGFLAYAIVRHHALNVRIITAEILVAIINLFVWGAILFFNLTGDKNKVLLLVLAILIFVFSLVLMKSVRKEIKQREDEALVSALEETNRRLRELDHQKIEFLNIAAHHLRTPVSIIRNYVAMMKDGDFGAVPENLREVLDHIYQSNQWLVRLSDEIINIAHLESGQTKFHLAQGDLCAVVNNIVGELKSKAEQKGLRLTAIEMGEGLSAHFDEEKIKFVLLNYIENAIKYTLGGEITVRAEKDGEGVSVVVKDTGIGFAKADQQDFFQKFKRGENARELEVNTSTGLGLYIVRKFVEGHHGRIWAKSDGVGKGSEFGFWIPLKPPSGVAMPPTKSKA